MKQIFFTIPYFHIPVYGYGVMLVAGFIASMYLARFLAKRSKLDPEIFANAAILALVMGVVGARLSHVLENFSDYTNEPTFWQNFVKAVNIREGGLTYYGGFLLAFPSLVLYGMWKKVPLPTGMDIIAPCLMIGLTFGRIGCYLNGCCYGAACDARLGVEFPYGSEAYVTQFNENQLKMPVPRALIVDESDLGKALEREIDERVAKQILVESLHTRNIPADREKQLRNELRNNLMVQEPLSSKQLSQLELNEKQLAGSLRSRDQVEKASKTPDGKRVEIDDKLHITLADLAAQQHANPVQAAEIYSSVIALLICAFLLAYFTLPHVPGRVFAAMMMIEGVFRYVLEMLRVEPAVIGRGTSHVSFLPPQSYSMVVSFFLVTGGVALWFVFGGIANRGKVQQDGRRGFPVAPSRVKLDA